MCGEEHTNVSQDLRSEIEKRLKKILVDKLGVSLTV
jgi:hypothetical protein